MAGVEAVRVLSVLDETVEGMRLLSYVTPSVLRAPDQVEALLGKGVAGAAAQYQHALYARTGKDDAAHEALIAAVLDLWRHLRRVPECEGKLAALQGERSEGVQHAVDLLAHLRDFARKRLTATVEEDRSVREHFEDVKLREEKAVSEKQQLQQRLKLERVQRQRQAAVMQRSHSAVEAQLTTMRADHAATVRSMKETAEAADAAALGAYSGRREKLRQAVEAARGQLTALQAENSEAEAEARQMRRRGELDVGVAIAEYDKELAARTTAVRGEQAALDALTEQVATLRGELIEMQEARDAHEAALERARRDAHRRRLADFMRTRAARTVQMYWRLHQVAAKKAKKAGAKGGKGKGKK